MKLKQFIFALVAMLFGFSVTASAEQLLVNCDYNSSTEGYGTTKFSDYAGAYAYATANGKTSATIVIEKTNTISGNCFDNNHKNYTKLAVVIKDGATMGNAASKWDMTYPVTVEPGGTLTCARSKTSSVSYIHIKNKLIVGEKGATKKAYVNFLSDDYQDCDISIRFNGSIEVYNADFYVQDLDAQGKLTIEDSKVEVDGAFASATSSFYPTTLTNSTITINGNLISGGLSDFAGGTSNQLGNVKLNNSTLTIKDGETKVAVAKYLGAPMTATGSTISVNNLTIADGATLNLNDGSTLNAENITTSGTGAVKIDGEKATIENGQIVLPVAQIGTEKYTTLADAVKVATAGQTITLIADVQLTEIVTIPEGKELTLDLNGKAITVEDAPKHSYALNNKGVLTIKDTKGNGTISARGIYNGYNGSDSNETVAGAKLTIESGKFVALDSDGGASILNCAELIINGGTFEGVVAAVNNRVKGVATLNGGNFAGGYDGGKSTSYLIQNNGGSLTINDANVVSGFGAVGCYSGTTIINGGSFLPTGWEGYTSHVVYVAAAADVTINGGTFKMNYPANLVPDSGSAVASYYNGKLSITGGSFTAHFDNVSPVELSKGSEITGGSYYNHSGVASTHSYVTNFVKKGYELGADGTVVKMAALLGSGTEADPYQINSVEDLIFFRNKVDEQSQDGSTQYAGKYIKLNADIDLADINWNPIGSMSGDHGSFKGVFDGGGHTISNLNVDQSGNGLGLFAYTTGNAVIKNLNLVNVTVKSTDNSNYVGGVVGNAYADTKIENVHVSGDVHISGRGYIGGIAGHGYVKMDNVSVVANEVGLITSTFWCAGGVLGYAGEGSTDIKNAHVEGLIITSAAGGLGAIVGMAEDNNGTQPISGSNLSAKNVEIKTYTGAYGDSYSNYALGYLYGGNSTSKLTGNLSVEDVAITTSNGVTPEVNDAVASIDGTIYFNLQSAIEAVAEGEKITVLRDVIFTTGANGSTNGISYTRGVSFTLDLNGKTITSNLGNNALRFKIGDGNNVTGKEVTVNIQNGKIVSGSNNWCAISAATADNSSNKLIMNLSNLQVEANKAGDLAVKSWTGAVINTTNVDITANYAGGFYACGGEIVLDNESSVTQKGLHTAPYMSYAFGVSSGGKMTINGGTYSAVPAVASDANNQGASHGSSVGGVMSSGGTLIINGGTFSNDNFGEAAPTAPRSLLMADAGAVVTINGGTFNAMAKIVDPTNNTGVASKNAQVTIAGGTYSANPTDAPYNLVKLAENYVAVKNNDGVWNVVKAAAKVGEKAYATLEEAFKAATSDCTIDILSDVTVDYNWDARYTGGKFTVPVTINGNGKTIKFTETVYDGGNYFSAFRFEADATVKNLTVDMEEAKSGFNGRFRAISSKGNLTVDNCTFIGNGSTNNTRAIIFGEGAGANATNLAISVTNSTFKGWKRGISDNENAQDVKTVTITGNTLTDAGVGVSAKETVTFTGNTVAGAYVNIKSYTAGNKLAVTATSNTLEANTDAAYNIIDAGGVVNAEGFKVVAKGNNFNGYTGADGIWGEVWGNARESFVIKVLDAKGNVMGTTSLNNIDGIIDGDVNVTWRLMFNAAANTDEYWTMKWTTAPSISNMPARVVLWVDGVEVSGGPVVLNGPDDINKIYAAVTDANGNILSCHTQLTDAVAASNNVAILRAGTYNVPTGKNLTITGAVEGVKFANIGAHNMGGASMTFNNVTFEYGNENYKGLQHAGNLVYNNCTFNGQVFLYGQSETLNNCTFNQTSADAYNVWTYGAKEVAFNECTFYSAGKSVLIYHENATMFNDVAVTKSTFYASKAVDGKAAIEMDASLTAGINLTIDAATTANGFATGSVSGNSLWNNKKGNADEANNDITVIVDGKTVLAPVYEAKIGEKSYRYLADAITAAKAGETVNILAGTYKVPTMKTGITVEGAVNADGTPAVLLEGTLSGTLDNLTLKNLHIKGGNAQRWAYAKGDLVFENVTFEATSVYALHFDGIAEGTNLTYKGCTIIGWAAMGGSPASCVFDGCTIKGNGTYGVIRTYFDATIKDCTFDVANVNTTDAYQDGIHAVDGAKVIVTDCTNKNGDMKDLVNVHASSVVTVNGVEYKNVAKVGNIYYATLAEAFTAVGDGAGKTVELIADVDLAGAEWTPVTFNGVFDGKGHTISNLVVNGAGNSDQGFFAQTNNGEIKNVTFNNAKVTGRLNVGVVAGTPYTSKYTNVKVTGHVEVNGMAYVGGVGGKSAYADWTDITVDVDATSYVKATSTENGTAYRTYVGGVIGFNGEGGHTFKNISSNIKVIGDVMDIGGIFGILHYGNKAENITFTGAVEAPAGATQVGGIAGVWHNQKGETVTINNAKSTGTVTIGDVTTTGSLVGGAYNAKNQSPETSGSLIIDGKEAWVGVAKIGDKPYATLAEALAAVQAGDNTIELLADCAEKVTITQVNGTNIVINGNGKTYSGTITVRGDKVANNFYNTETLTFQNINFAPAYNTYAITAERNTYARNITVDGCTFKGNNDVYGIRVRNGYNYTVKNTTAEGVYTFLNASEALVGLTVEDVTVECANVAFAGAYGFGDASFKKVTVVSDNNGVKVNNPNSSALKFEKCSITAKAPVTFIENAGVTSALTAEFNDANTMVVNNGGTYWFNIVEADATDATFKAIVNDAALDMSNTAFVASVGNVYYSDLQKAIEAAEDGATVVVARDIELDAADCVTNYDGYSVFVNVAGKAITIDLNGKAVTANLSASQFASAKKSLLMAVLSVDTNGNLTLNDGKGTGKVAVTANDASVYSLISNYDKSAKLTINGGSYELDAARAQSSLIHSDPSEAVVVNGGNFYLGNVNTGVNNSPWIFNVNGNNEGHVTVNGGTFNYDVNHQYWAFEVSIDKELALKNNGNGTWTVVNAIAYVTEANNGYTREAGYATVEEAINSTYGNVVTILAGDYTMDIAANKAGVTVQGEVDENGQNLVNITGRVVASTGVTVKNLNVKNEKTGQYDCALSINHAKDVTIDGVNLSGYNGIRMGYANGNITIKNSVIEGSSNAVHFDGNAGGVIAFENSTITGWCAYASTIESVTYTNCTLNKGQYSGQRFYNKNVNFVDCTFSEGFKIELTGKNQNVSFTDADMTMEDVKALMNKESYITSHNVTLNDTQVTYAVSAQGKLYSTLQAAIDDLPVGGTATYWLNLKSDNVLAEGVVVPAGVKATINLNGFNIIGTPAEAKAYAVITNRGTLTIEGNGSVICNHTLAGSTGYAVNTITNCGTLTIDGATIENKSTAQYQIGYAIDNNSTSTDAVVNIKRGKVTASGSLYYDGIRQFCNSETKENSVVVEGGEVSTIWMQNPSDGTTKNTKDVKGSVTIKGGNVGVLSFEPSANFEAAMTGGHVGEISYFQTATGRDLKEFVTGGTFATPIDENFLAWGYQLTGDTAPYVVEYTRCRESVTIVDGQMTEFVNEEDIEVGTLTYKRELYDDLLWNALFVPFEIPVSTLTDLGLEVVYFNDVHSYDDDNNGTIDRMTMESIKLTNGTLRANHPYMFRRTSDDAVTDLNLTLTGVTLYSTKEEALIPVGCSSAYTNYEIGGSYQQMSAADLDGRLIINEEGNWTLMDEKYTLSPFRLHLTIEQKAGSPVIIEESALRAISIRVIGEGNGDTTDIKYYDVENQNVELIFDLQGRRVLEPKKGGIYIINGKKVYYNK